MLKVGDRVRYTVEALRTMDEAHLSAMFANMRGTIREVVTPGLPGQPVKTWARVAWSPAGTIFTESVRRDWWVETRRLEVV